MSANMINGYVECALWSSWEDGEHLDAAYDADEIADATMREMREDCLAFMHANASDLETFSRLAGVDESQWGHSFWLSRNGHGAGFLDWTHPAELGAACQRLQEAARSYGTVDLYVGDDGRVHS